MRFLLSSALLGLVWFVAANAAASLVAWMLGAWIIRESRPSGARPLLAVRLMPAVASGLFVLTVFLPAHWRFEPAETDESFGYVLACAAAIGGGLLLRSAWRAFRAAVAGHRFAALARRAASVAPGGAFALEGLPGMSLAGIWRPRILIGADALAALTSGELDVAISHEVAHRHSMDNLKRFLIFCAPDLFGWTAVARHLDDRWQAEAECDADTCAVKGDADRAVMLASALVKVARLGGASRLRTVSPAWTAVSPAWTAVSPAWTTWSAFHVPTLLELRVKRLVSGSALRPVASGKLWWSVALGAGTSAALWLLGFSYTLHQVTEAMVSHLP